MTGPGKDEHPAACSMQIDLEFENRLPSAEIQARLDAFLSDLTTFLKDNGCKLIGHIKGLLDAGKNEQLFFSITSFDEGTRYKGDISGEFEKAKLSMNVIVYGIEEESINGAIQEYLRKQFPEYRDQ